MTSSSSEFETLPADLDHGKLTESQQALWASEECQDVKDASDIVLCSDVQVWSDYARSKSLPALSQFAAGCRKLTRHSKNAKLNGKVAVWRGNIVKLAVGAIVNAANKGLLGGGGVDGAIHRAAGPKLRRECEMLRRPGETGRTKLTKAYRLPAGHVLHTIGPVGEKPVLLRSCYDSVLRVAQINSIRSIGFCCVSTGVYGYPPLNAADVVLAYTRHWLEQSGNADSVDKLVFICYSEAEVRIYEDLLQCYFPVD
jgi:O-acetyl-ADP-ribose deacetylase